MKTRQVCLAEQREVTVDVFGARAILAEYGLFTFEPPSNELLEEYLKEFGSEDEHENQFRSNMACAGAAEFAVWRNVLNGKPAIEYRRPVLPADVTFAILTADTLRTRPCRTANATRRGRIFPADLFMLSGEASKAWYVLNEQGSNAAELDSKESFLNLGAKLYSVGPWEANRLVQVAVGLDRLTVLFAFIRMNVVRNHPQRQATSNIVELGRSLGLFGRELQA